MELAEILRGVGIASVSLLAVAWLVASFTRSPATRSRVAWLGACALYLALGSLFFTLVRGAWEADNTLAMLAFGFLLFVFSAGFLVSVVKTIGVLRAGATSSEHATH